MIILRIIGSPETGQGKSLLEAGVIHDFAAAILKDGKVMDAYEEERQGRIKHNNYFPVNPIESWLKAAEVLLSDIDYFAFAVCEDVLNAEIEEKTGKPGEAQLFLQNMLENYLGYKVDTSK